MVVLYEVDEILEGVEGVFLLKTYIVVLLVSVGLSNRDPNPAWNAFSDLS